MRKHDRSEEHTTFQESSPYFPETDSRADVAIVYGLNPRLRSALPAGVKLGTASTS